MKTLVEVLAKTGTKEIRVLFLVSKTEQRSLQGRINPRPKQDLTAYRCEHLLRKRSVILTQLRDHLKDLGFRIQSLYHHPLADDGIREMSPVEREKRGMLLTFVFGQGTKIIPNEKRDQQFDDFASRIWDFAKIRLYTHDTASSLLVMYFADSSKLDPEYLVDDAEAREWGLVKVHANTPMFRSRTAKQRRKARHRSRQK
jgi:hypothetical protein